MIVKAPQEGDHHALQLQARLKDHAGAARPGVWPVLKLTVTATVYHWSQAFHDLR